MKERTLMAVEELFQLPDVPRPDFPHDLFVFHCVLVYVMEYRREAKRLRGGRVIGRKQFSHR
jgi:hypothetical protein